MNKRKFYGWQQICRFSYVQTMKSKAMKVTLLILCVLAICSVPVSSLVMSQNDVIKATKIQKAYICGNDEKIAKKFAVDYQGKYKNIKTQFIQESERNEREEMMGKEHTDYVVVHILSDMDASSHDYGIEIQVIFEEETNITEEDANDFAEYLVANKERFLLEGKGVDENQIANVMKENEYQIFQVNKDGTLENMIESLSQTEYNVTYVYLMLILFAVLISGSKVAELLVTEKTSKVMEYLLTNVRAFALLLGKVVSTIFVVVTVIVMLGVSLTVSFFINHFLTGEAVIPVAVQNVFRDGVFQNVTLIHVILALLILLVGFLFYGFIAGLAGATVGKVEELSEGLKLFSFSVLVGCYLVLAFVMFSATGNNMGIFSYIVYYLPLSSVFIVPIYLLIGKISLQTAFISFGISTAMTIFVCLFVAKIFESVIYYNGNVIKFKELLNLYKNIGKSSEAEDGK